MIQAHYQGVIIPYRNYVGKKFDEIKEKIELDQKQDTGVEPVGSDINIQFNSTYLEVLDKAYNWRGGINFFSIGLFLMSIFGMTMMLLIIPKVGWDILNLFIVFLLFSIFFLVYKTLLKNDLFGYTHYPIRFNRKNKKVYVFKSKDDIRIFDWDSLKVAVTLITIDHKNKDHDIRFGQLDENGLIVDTFCLPYLTSTRAIYTEEDGYQFINEIENLNAASNWEYIRCYMEEDVEISYQAVRGLVPLDKKRESLLQSMKVAWYFIHLTYSFKEVETTNGTEYLVDIQQTYHNNFLAMIVKGLGFFIILILFIGRPFVMYIAKRPKWSKAVEEACVVDPNDQYNYEKFPNQGRVKLEVRHKPPN